MVDKFESDYPILDSDNSCYIPEIDTKVFNCTIQENKNIKGFVFDTESQTDIKALYNDNRKAWFFGSNNIKRSCLIPMSERSMEDRKRVSKLGITKSIQSKQNKKSLNDIAKAMLDTQLSDSQVKKLLGVDVLPDFVDSDNMTVGAMLIIRGLESALVDKNFKWAEFVRDTAGYKPKNEVDISADIMTDADRQLMENIQKRLG